MRQGWAVLLLLPLLFASLLMVGASPARVREHRVLFLFPDSDAITAAATVTKAVRKVLVEHAPLKIQTFSEFLELSRFPDEAHRRRVVGHLAEKYAQARPDLVLALGPDALRIAIADRSVLAPEAAIVFCCVSPVTLATMEPPADVTGIVSEFDVSQTLALARRLQPDARHLVVIAGAAPFDLRWAQTARNQLSRDAQFDVRYLVGLPRETLLEEVSKLGRDTIVILLTVFKDGAGRDFVPGEMAEEIARVSSAPVYGPYDTSLGRGLVGGYMDTFDAIGTQTAELILRILEGEDPRTIPPQRSTTQAFRVDARQLERWGLRESDLPDETVVMFKTTSAWGQHRNLILVAIATVLLQSAILVFLLSQMRRRRLAELMLRRSEEHRESIQDEGRARIAQDLHDSTAQHLTAIGLNLMRLREGTAPDTNTHKTLEEMKGSLSEATKELRAYIYLLHPPPLQRDGLGPTLQRYVEEFGRRTGLRTEIRSNHQESKVSSPLQRSILRIVQEALSNVHRRASASRVSVHFRRVGKRLHLVISDDSSGKISGSGEDPCMGIQGMSSRVERFGGRLRVRCSPTGTIVHAVVPVR